MSWANRLASVGLLLCGAGCRAAPPPAAADPRVHELEERIARLEAQAEPANLDDGILALEVERAGLLVIHTPEHPAILRIDRRIEALETARAEEARARRERMLRRLEAQRAEALVTYAPDHEIVRRLDVQIAFLEDGAG
jgi:hypothetical protein